MVNSYFIYMNDTYVGTVSAYDYYITKFKGHNHVNIRLTINKNKRDGNADHSFWSNQPIIVFKSIYNELVYDIKLYNEI